MNSNQTKREERWLLDEKYGGHETDAYREDVLRLHGGEPLAYVIGWTPFLGQRIFLDSHPLIPRTETEYWIEAVLQTFTKTASTPPVRILDLFAGSGAIGIAMLAHLPTAEVHFGELETRHFPTIEKSIRENGLDASRARLIETDVWSAITDSYDVILANPPYIKEGSVHVESSVLDFEPPEALFAENDGMSLIEGFVAGAPRHLTDKGVVWCEHDPEQSERVATLFNKEGLTHEVWKDQYGNERASIGKRRG